MEGFNVGKILAGLINPGLYFKRIKQDSISQGANTFNSAFAQARPNPAPQQNPINNLILNNQLQMNLFYLLY